MAMRRASVCRRKARPRAVSLFPNPSLFEPPDRVVQSIVAPEQLTADDAKVGDPNTPSDLASSVAAR